MRHSTNLDPYEYALSRLRSTPYEFVWQPGADEAWSDELRARLRKVIGFPEKIDLPTDIEVVEHRSMEGYDREILTYSTRPGLHALAYLLTPTAFPAPRPAVICVPGHGAGVDALVGKAPADYQNQFALQCVRAGFTTLAIEPIGFGHRMSAGNEQKGSSCVRDSMAALMLGESMIGWRCLDAIASLELLLSKPEVDPNRIAIMGISGGGLVAFWAACLEQRFAAAVVSGYFNTFFDSILSIEHCVDNFAPGLANLVEMPDMVSLIAPRNLFVESGTEDPIFPAKAFHEACRIATAIYADRGASGAFASDLFPGDHIFSGLRAIPQLKGWLGI